MKPIIIMSYRKSMNSGSYRMRAVQMAEALARKGYPASCYRGGLPAIDNAVTIIVKTLCARNIQDCKGFGHKIIYDMIDLLAADAIEVNDALDVIDEVDAVICPNSLIAKQLEKYKPHKVVIHHHWDPSYIQNLEGLRKSTEYKFRLGYLGTKKNAIYLDQLRGLMYLTETWTHAEIAPFFTCHYNVRNFHQQWSKPNTKVSLAAGVDSNIITTRDAAALDILDESYPYYTDDHIKGVIKTIRKAEEGFGSKEWNEGLAMMREVKRKTSIDAIADQYIELIRDIA